MNNNLLAFLALAAIVAVVLLLRRSLTSHSDVPEFVGGTDYAAFPVTGSPVGDGPILYDTDASAAVLITGGGGGAAGPNGSGGAPVPLASNVELLVPPAAPLPEFHPEPAPVVTIAKARKAKPKNAKKPRQPKG